jgi:hypothetical protein
VPAAVVAAQQVLLLQQDHLAQQVAQAVEL